jgi:hypothetical protein
MKRNQVFKEKFSPRDDDEPGFPPYDPPPYPSMN